MVNSTELAERYAAVWNEPNIDRRREAVAGLWAADAVHMLQPPEEVRKAAAGLAVTATFEARGHQALEERVARAYEEFVAPGTFVFRARGNADRIGDVVKFNWEMLPAEGGPAAAVGLEVLILDGDGLIERDYQFIEP